LNGWGLAFAPDGPFCVADTATGVATFYSRLGRPLPLVITIPAAPGQPLGPVGTPSGIIYNPTSDFIISAHGRSAPAQFLFDTLDGLICGWNPNVDPDHAIVMVDNSTEGPNPASYTGLVIAQNGKGQNVLYAADSGGSPTTSNNRVDMFDGGFHPLGNFTDVNVATQYPGNTVFQVEDVNSKLFVTFGGFAPPFGGVVDVFDTDGHLLTPNHFAANAPGAGPLENPWGTTLAPADFGQFRNDLLIGNVEGAGNINAFDPGTGAFLGQLRHPDGTPVAVAGLWDLTFGGGSPENGKTNELFFTAGVNSATFTGNGLFGVLHAAGGGSAADDPGRGDGTPSIPASVTFSGVAATAVSSGASLQSSFARGARDRASSGVTPTVIASDQGSPAVAPPSAPSHRSPVAPRSAPIVKLAGIATDIQALDRTFAQFLIDSDDWGLEF
jgi:uncharacterized protein (TIGR03118 family)